ncbi:MAG: sugar phosphate isomerase/epimerase, partial [Phycisphaeraceae bacterium]|nr:sugar phosphate isomerase/epimerase [Phycisphaeraceae bacterium]
GADRATWESTSIDRLKQLVDRADEYGLRLMHENEMDIFGQDLDEVLALQDAINEGPIGWIFDFSNYRYAGNDIWANWEALADRTDAFHLKDSNDDDQHVPIGEGAGEARRILADARDRGWSGPLTLEPHLAYSDAVMATGPSGEAAHDFANMSNEECFQVGAEAAHSLLKSLDVNYE